MRKSVLIKLSIALVVLLAGNFQAATAQTTAAASSKPNIVLILADDLDLQLKTLDFMPNLQKLLIKQGTTFSNFFVPIPLCCPSRSSLLRSQYAHNHQIFNNYWPSGGFTKALTTGLEDETIATLLQRVGYRTVLLGKYLNEYPRGAPTTYIPPGWSEWFSPSPDAAYNQFNYRLNENGRLVSYGAAPRDYLGDVLTAKALDFIKRTAAAKQPFFMYLATYSPHSPAPPAPRHANLFPNAIAPRLPSFNEADVSDKPRRVRVTPKLSASDIGKLDGEYRKRLQSMQAVDEMIARLVQTLRATGQLANTYIVFTSDNGYTLGSHRLRASKYFPYEENIHLPLIIRGPCVAAGRTTTALVSIIDLAPTFAELAGTRMPAFADGRSLIPWLSASPPPRPWRQAVLFEQYPQAVPPPGPVVPLAYKGLRTLRYKYVEHNNDRSEREFYDLQTDPYELNNLASTANPATLARFSAWLQAYANCARARCRSIEQQAVP